MTPPPPERPPEAVLIQDALRRQGMTMADAAEQAGISDTRWRHIIKGYRVVKGERVPVRATDIRLAHMAQAVGVTPEELEQVGRGKAADDLRALLAEPDPDLSELPGGEIDDQLEWVLTQSSPSPRRRFRIAQLLISTARAARDEQNRAAEA